MIIENMQAAEQNPEGMAYLFHPFGVSDHSEIIDFYNHHTPSGLKFNCVTPNFIKYSKGHDRNHAPLDVIAPLTEQSIFAHCPNIPARYLYMPE
jgi:hypothetical protein